MGTGHVLEIARTGWYAEELAFAETLSKSFKWQLAVGTAVLQLVALPFRSAVYLRDMLRRRRIQARLNTRGRATFIYDSSFFIRRTERRTVEVCIIVTPRLRAQICVFAALAYRPSRQSYANAFMRQVSMRKKSNSCACQRRFWSRFELRLTTVACLYTWLNLQPPEENFYSFIIRLFVLSQSACEGIKRRVDIAFNAAESNIALRKLYTCLNIIDVWIFPPALANVLVLSGILVPAYSYLGTCQESERIRADDKFHILPWK